MPRSSRASLSDETIQELENQFYAFLNSLSSTDRKKFFAEFLTNEEKMMMYKRLALYWCLLEGYSLAKIQQMIGVTHDTTRVYNKRKNTLSEEFKNLIGRIGKSDMSNLEDVKNEVTAETKHENSKEIHDQEDEKPVIDHSINLNPDAPIETRPIDEPLEEIGMSHEEKKDEFQMDPMPSFDDLRADMHAKNEPTEKSEGIMHGTAESEGLMDKTAESEGLMDKTAESEGLMPSEKKETSDEQNDNNNGEGKKKGGLAKFFGF